MKLILLLLISTFLFAHPHTFIDVYPTIKVKNNKITYLRFRWEIDEMTSSMLIMDIDQNGDGKIDDKENKYLEENYFNVFADYDYYTYIKVKNKTIKFPKITNFKASIKNHKVCYAFDVDLKTDISDTVIEFGDSDFYVAMMLKDEFVTVSGAKVKTSGVDNDFYYGYRLEFIK